MTDALQHPALPHHRLSVERRLGPLTLHAQLNFTAPWTLIFGPSGSGKSSLLRAACGLLGRDGVEFAARAADGHWQHLASDTQTPTHERRLAYAPQNPTLFPHLSVRENVAFAAASRGTTREHSTLIDSALALFELQSYARRMPHELSGGERRRVNMARAFAVPDATLMLLDEPFSGIDRALRDALLPRMMAWLGERNLPVISVSHDVDEALLLDAEVVVLHHGAVTAQGPASVVLHDERLRLLHILSP